jgi:hypothetical protein
MSRNSVATPSGGPKKLAAKNLSIQGGQVCQRIRPMYAQKSGPSRPLFDPFKERELLKQHIARIRSNIIANITETIGTALKAGWVTADDAQRWLDEELAYIDESAPAAEQEAA